MSLVTVTKWRVTFCVTTSLPNSSLHLSLRSHWLPLNFCPSVCLTGVVVTRSPPFPKLSQLEPRSMQSYVKLQAARYSSPFHVCIAITLYRKLSALSVATLNNLIVGCGGLATIIISGDGLARKDCVGFCQRYTCDGLGEGCRIFVKKHR